MKKNIIIFLSIFFLNIISCVAQEKELKFEHFTSEEGLSQNVVTCMMQDSMGFLWIGTADGVNKYDAYNFEVYKNEIGNDNSLSSSWITVLLQDKEGYIWIATRNGLNRFNPKTKVFKRFYSDEKNPNTLSNNWVYSLIQDNNNDIWIGTRNGLNKFDKKTQTFTRFFNDENKKNSLPNNIVRSIFQDHKGLIWIGTHGKGLAAIDPKTQKFVHFLTEDKKNKHSLVYNFVRAIYEDREHNLWVGTENGISKMNNKTDRVGHFVNYHSTDFGLKQEYNVKSILQDKKGDIWFGSWGMGVNKYVPERDTFINYTRNNNKPTSLSDHNVTSILEDKFGIIWMGTWNSGLNKYDPKKEKFKAYLPSAKQKYEVMEIVTSIFEDNKENNIWIGTARNGLTCLNRETDKLINYKYQENNPYSIQDPQSAVYTICMDEKRTLWIGTRFGLQKLDKKTKKFVVYNLIKNKTRNFNHHVVRCLYIKSGVIWVGTDDGLYKLIIANTETGEEPDDVKFDVFLNNPQDSTTISDNRIRKITEDRNGNLWIGTANGLNRFDTKTEKFTQFLNDKENINSLNQNYVWSVFVDKDNIVWIGTNGGGLNKYNQKTKTFTFYTEKNGLPNNGIWGVLQDKNQNIWLSTNRGLSVFNPETEVFKSYNTKDGLQGNQFNGGSYFFNDETGEIFFGGTNGFNAFFPEDIKDNPYKAPVVITNFQIMNEDVPVNKNSILKKAIDYTDFIEITHEDYIFAFEFSYLHFSSPELNQYKYILENFNDDWIPISADRRFATYTNLDPGDYIFRVMASNSDGIWSDKSVEVKIRILPPIWKTLWFRALGIIVIIFCIFLFYRIRMNSLKKQKQILKKQVKERTTELIEQNVEIEKQANFLQELTVELEEKQEEIQQQSDILSDTNYALNREREHTLGSIRYAKTIQEAILPRKEHIEDFFECFILFRPKDIVSGDFYWFVPVEKIKENNNVKSCLIAAIDCTGHGVPGAFMSLIGNRLLNEIVTEKKVKEPNKILDLLNLKVIKALKQDETDNNDGMDICMCRLDKYKNGNCNVIFSGAKRHLFIYKKDENEIKIIKGDRQFIGGSSSRKKKYNFTKKEILLEQGDIIFLTSDGLIDQNNYLRKRLGTKRFLKILLKNAKKTIAEQQNLLIKELENYQKNENQRDDITVIAVKI